LGGVGACVDMFSHACSLPSPVRPPTRSLSPAAPPRYPQRLDRVFPLACVLLSRVACCRGVSCVLWRAVAGVGGGTVSWVVLGRVLARSCPPRPRVVVCECMSVCESRPCVVCECMAVLSWSMCTRSLCRGGACGLVCHNVVNRCSPPLAPAPAPPARPTCPPIVVARACPCSNSCLCVVVACCVLWSRVACRCVRQPVSVACWLLLSCGGCHVSCVVCNPIVLAPRQGSPRSSVLTLLSLSMCTRTLCRVGVVSGRAVSCVVGIAHALVPHDARPPPRYGPQRRSPRACPCSRPLVCWCCRVLSLSCRVVSCRVLLLSFARVLSCVIITTSPAGRPTKVPRVVARACPCARSCPSLSICSHACFVV
jgi:hypothetical protein